MYKFLQKPLYNILMQKTLPFLLTLILTACSLPQNTSPTATLPPPIESALPSETPIPPTSTSTPEFTATATQTLTPTPTVTPTYAVLRGKVLVEHANCRYGPGAPYLYKYGLVGGSNLEIIGRLDDANWLEIQAIGGDNPCWVKANLMEVQGDLLSIAPVYPDLAPLPLSPYYNPLTLRDVSREGNQVTIRWYGMALRAGDEEFENAPLYLAEIWACENGEIHFTPYGLWEEKITFTDEKGCSERSYARIYFSEKHGYAGPTEMEFPE